MSMRARVFGFGTIYWADWRDEISYNGHVWEPHAFDVMQMAVGKVHDVRAQVVAFDTDKEIATLSKSGGVTGEIGTLSLIKLVAGTWVLDDEYAQIELPISSCSGNYPEIIMELSAMHGWKRTGGIPLGDKTCRHVFKGLYCQYAGVDTACPRDREHCRTVKLNLLNYGGYHFAQDAGAVIQLPQPYVMPGSGTGGRIQPGWLGGDGGIEEDPTPWNPRRTSPPAPGSGTPFRRLR